LQNKQNTDYFTRNKLKDMFNMHVCDFAYKYKFANRSISDDW